MQELERKQSDVYTNKDILLSQYCSM